MEINRKDMIVYLRDVIDSRIMLRKEYESMSCGKNLKHAWQNVDIAIWKLEEALFAEIQNT